ncbi:MAG: hypothetical protein HYV07_19855 [Deltaproteobacteria bacterium]|nr:hypothetical protein [Deltaproteobacteria bacterium]
MNRIILIPLTLTFALAQSSAARADDTRDAVVVSLSGFESVPTFEELAGRHGIAPLTARLVSIAEDTTKPVFVRSRAVNLLGKSGQAEAVPMLDRLLRGPGESFVVTRAALQAAGNQRGALVRRVGMHLDSEDVHLREIAIKSLVKIGGAESYRLLRSRQSKERSPMLAKELERVLAVPR